MALIPSQMRGYKTPPFGHGALFERSVPAAPVSGKAALALTVHGLAQGEDETAGEARRAAQSELEHVQTGPHQCSRRLTTPGHAGASPQRRSARRRRSDCRHPGCSLPPPCCCSRRPGRSSVASHGGCYWAPQGPPAARPGRRRPVAVVRSVQPVDGRLGRRCARAETSSAVRFTNKRETKRAFRGTLGPHMDPLRVT